jgi:glycosyltransferase involved in cell wall biosynthesis
MRVGIGTTVWSRGLELQQLDGIGHYTQEIFSELSKGGTVLKPVVFGSGHTKKIQSLPVARLGRYSVSAGLSAMTGLPFSLGKQLGSAIDVFHATDHLTPRLRNIPVVATLMDAIPLSHPEWTNQNLRGLKNWLWKKTGQWADHVITISEYSRREITRHFGIPESLITVTPLGVDERYFDRMAAKDVEDVLGKYRINEQYFLFVGTLQPRKNVERIVQAHEALPDQVRQSTPLVIVGRPGWGCNELVAKLNSYPADGSVRWLQNVNDFEKRALMQGATAMVFPSLLEGFGLPVLEGFASQTPVITSNTTSIPEVAADAAWLIDPTNTSQLTEAMATLARESAIADALVTKGLARARLFTWDACAQSTRKVYESVLHGAAK